MKKLIRLYRSIISSGIAALAFAAASQTAFAASCPAGTRPEGEEFFYKIENNGLLTLNPPNGASTALHCINVRKLYSYIFNNNRSELIADKFPKVHFPSSPTAPLFNKVSGLNINAATTSNSSGWITTDPNKSGKIGYYMVEWTFQPSKSEFEVALKFVQNTNGIQNTGKKSEDNLPIYKIKNYPWLGVSFQLSADIAEQPRGGRLIKTPGPWGSGANLPKLKVRASKNTGVLFNLRAKLHQLSTPPNGASLPHEIKLGEILSIDPPIHGTGSFFDGKYELKSNAHVDVKLRFPGSINNQCTPNQPTGGFPMVAPAPLGNMVAEVQTYPEKSSSRIHLYEMNETGRRAGTSPVQPSFQNRKVMIRLAQGADGVVFTDKSSGRSNGEFDISNTRHNDEWQDLLLRWTDRRDNDDSYFNGKNTPEYSQSYRIRQNDDRNLGDIINSPIAGIGDFMATAANDGMVHIFKRDANNASYDLKLSYIPGTIARKDDRNKDTTLAKTLRHFANKNYTNNLYGVDGGFVLRKAKVGNTDHVFMFGAMGQGGKGAYALDLAGLNQDSSTWISNVPLFDAQDGDLGFTVGTPQIGKVRDGKYAGFLANGYGGNKTALYVYDMLGKNLLRKIDVPNGVRGLSSPTLVDTDFDGTVDIAYAGDRDGNMYRFDLRDSVANNWKVVRIYAGNANKPVTSAPAISRLAKNKYVVIFGTGSDLNEDGVKDQTPQSIYGIFDDLPESMTAPETPETAKEGELVKQTIEKKGDKLFLSGNETKGKRGWKIDLGNGDRVTIKPEMVLRTAFVTIRNYTSFGVCAAGTTVLGIDSETGGKLTKRNARPFIKSSNPPSSTNTNEPPLGCEKGTVSNQKGENYICPNGFVYPKLLTISYRDGKKKDESPFTLDGDAGGNGSGDEDGPANKNPNNTCFKEKSEDGSRTFLMSDMGNLDVTGPLCGGKLKRISWREIFF
ncbi:PilC family type IV pilus tip adhesin [Neisseria cinerea]|uniref:PilC family type IV pilus tip adhesin n=1 Tax=Neisseria cinerea TaxID=483 RepID=UPI002B1D33D4|nr:PilC family type IV pilus tip adhesin [Neisseria cinerea]